MYPSMIMSRVMYIRFGFDTGTIVGADRIATVRWVGIVFIVNESMEQHPCTMITVNSKMNRLSVMK